MDSFEYGELIDIDEHTKKKKFTKIKKDYILIDNFYNSLLKCGMIREIKKGYIYDKDEFDYYITLYDKNRWSLKLIMKRSLVELVKKRNIIEYLIIKKSLNED